MLSTERDETPQTPAEAGTRLSFDNRHVSVMDLPAGEQHRKVIEIAEQINESSPEGEHEDSVDEVETKEFDFWLEHLIVKILKTLSKVSGIAQVEMRNNVPLVGG